PLTLPPAPRPPLFPYTTLFRSPRSIQQANRILAVIARVGTELAQDHLLGLSSCFPIALINCPQILPSPLVSQPRSLLFSVLVGLDRKSTRLNSSHVSISYAVFC